MPLGRLGNENNSDRRHAAAVLVKRSRMKNERNEAREKFIGCAAAQTADFNQRMEQE